jgi:hypothetical protein
LISGFSFFFDQTGRIDAFFGKSGILFSFLNHPPSTLDLQPGQGRADYWGASSGLTIRVSP